eukprot:3730495-Rhodomonas_salina.1
MVECNLTTENLIWNSVKSAVKLIHEELVQQILEGDLAELTTSRHRVGCVSKIFPIEGILKQEASNELSNLSRDTFVEK